MKIIPVIGLSNTADDWAAQHIDVYLTAFETEISKEKIITDEKPIDEDRMNE